jgi:hypothetical protein
MRSTSTYGALFLAVTTLCIAALWIPPYNAFVDLPSHLARLYVIHNYEQVSNFQDWFRLSPTLLPNLALEIIAGPLLTFTDPVTAGKIFFSLYVLIFAAACHFLFRRYSASYSFVAIPCLFACFNSQLQDGFANSSFSIALALLALSAWLYYTSARRWLLWIGLAALTTLTFLAHLAGYFVLSLSISAISAWRLFRKETTVTAILADLGLLLPAVLLYLTQRNDQVAVGEVTLSSPLEKLVGLGNVFLSNIWQLDTIRVLLIAGAATILIVRRHASIRIEPLVATIALLAAYLVIPKQMTPGGGSGADMRLTLPFYVLLAASFTVRTTALSKWSFVVVLAVSTCWLGGLLLSWMDMSRRTAAVVETADRVPPGLRVLPVTSLDASHNETRRRRGILHAASYSVVRRHAVTANFFAMAGGQPVIFRDSTAWPTMDVLESGSFQVLQPIAARYDFILGCYFPNEAKTAITAIGAQAVANDYPCTLWRMPSP